MNDERATRTKVREKRERERERERTTRETRARESIENKIVTVRENESESIRRVQDSQLILKRNHERTKRGPQE